MLKGVRCKNGCPLSTSEAALAQSSDPITLSSSEGAGDGLGDERAFVNHSRIELNEGGTVIDHGSCAFRVIDSTYPDNGELAGGGSANVIDHLEGAAPQGRSAQATAFFNTDKFGRSADGCVGGNNPIQTEGINTFEDGINFPKGEVRRNFEKNGGGGRSQFARP